MSFSLVSRRRSPHGPFLPMLALPLIAVLLAVLPTSADVPADRTVEGTYGEPMHYPKFFDETAFDVAIRRAAGEPSRPVPGVRAAVFPHHWLAGHLITETLRDIAASGDFDRVILIGPNHVNAGSPIAATSDLAWQTPVGRLDADEGAVAGLEQAGAAAIEPGVLTYEHSIAGIVPALAYYLPDAHIVPIITRHGMTADEVHSLANLLADMMSERTVLLASVDFSHYLPAEIARSRDGETITALENFNTATILGFDNDHLDSAPSMATLVETMRLIGATSFDLRDNTNSADLGGPPNEPVTSYVTGFFQ